MHYVAFLLDKEVFSQSVRPLMTAADRGDFTAVVTQATEFLSSLGRGKWLLEGLGTSARELGTLEGNELAGFSFLVLLSRHLQGSPFDTGRLDIDLLAEGLAQAGWPDAELRLLGTGNAIPCLLKLEDCPDPLARPDPDDPQWNDRRNYWWWARPLNALRAGWWDVMQLSDLLQRLVNSRASLGANKGRILGYYSTTCRLFDTALKLDRALLYIVS